MFHVHIYSYVALNIKKVVYKVKRITYTESS